jgi:signal transduction histidine kinase
MIRSMNALLAAMRCNDPLARLDTILEATERLGALDPVQRQHVETLRCSARSLKSVIENLIELSRLDRGEIELAHAPFEVDDLVYECRDSFAVSAHRKGIGLVAHVAPEASGTAIGDAPRVRQVLFNLIGNAVRFTEKGRVALRARAVTDPASLVFEVEDTGIGIALEYQAAIFQRFAQADGGAGRRFGGCGVGLALSRELARAMGGDLAVASVLGVGSLFRVSLPLTMKVRLDP